MLKNLTNTLVGLGGALEVLVGTNFLTDILGLMEMSARVLREDGMFKK